MRIYGLFVVCGLCLLAGCGGGGGGGSTTTPTAISISPTTASLNPSATQAFTASVTHAANTAVIWSVQEGTAGGAVSSAGVYTAPATTGTYHVVATSQADTSKTAVATVKVTAPVGVTVTISPTTATTSQGQSVAFTATVTGTPNTAVTWGVQEGSVGGTITADGVYTPVAVTGTFHVIAISQADSSKTAVATVTVQAGSATGTIN